jgi:hypothetical protein
MHEQQSRAPHLAIVISENLTGPDVSSAYNQGIVVQGPGLTGGDAGVHQSLLSDLLL